MIFTLVLSKNDDKSMPRTSRTKNVLCGKLFLMLTRPRRSPHPVLKGAKRCYNRFITTDILYALMYTHKHITPHITYYNNYQKVLVIVQSVDTNHLNTNQKMEVQISQTSLERSNYKVFMSTKFSCSNWRSPKNCFQLIKNRLNTYMVITTFKMSD